jgi:hypothetical protein
MSASVTLCGLSRVCACKLGKLVVGVQSQLGPGSVQESDHQLPVTVTIQPVTIQTNQC